ncbi:kanadaptin-like [Ornithodoros turicata]|uniref:kanadaptin-like n=1 Tax=Ornithodoros turicata TaxID=34597 RepID=UPI003138AC8E
MNIMDTEVSTTTDSERPDDPDVNTNGDMVTSSTSDASTRPVEEDDSSEVSSSDARPSKESFKLPILTGPRPGKQKSLKTGAKPLPECTDLPLPSSASEDFEKEPESSSSSKPTSSNIPYEEPPWSGIPDRPYSFQVLKSGVIVSSVDLDKPFMVVGRKEDCDIVMEHPSISRYHAVVQYRAVQGEPKKSGFYVYDLDSTHGTCVNKNQVRPRSYTKISVGHIVKFGGSTRGFLLEGPEDDQEEESPLTVTEIKALRKKHEEEMKRQEAEEKAKEEAAKAKQEEEGISWGIDDDAEDEDPCAENPFASLASNEELYVDDPKKTLRGWFEREGYELQYNVEEKGYSHFVCTIDLPVDSPTGEPVVAEASVKGKKKEAVIACALEACRILDRYGELRKAHHEGRKRKEKNWEENDFYDSDEDTFLDRTGTIEKKREMRMKMAKKENEVETYDTLVEKLRKVEREIMEIQQKLEASKQAAKDAETGAEDSLDAFMSLLKSQTLQDKAQRSKLRQQLATLMQDRARLAKLANIAKPAGLPPLTSTLVKPQAKDGAASIKKALPMTGSMKGHPSRKRPVSATVVQPAAPALQSATCEDEEEEEDDEDSEGQVEEKPQQNADKVSEAADERGVEKGKELPKDEDKVTSPEPQKRIMGPARPPGDTLTFAKQKTESTKSEESKKKAKSGAAHFTESSDDYIGWLPPEGQTGDGKTHLNTKYGY